MTMTCGQLRNATLGTKKSALGSEALVFVRLPGGTIAPIVGYTCEKDVIVLETVMPEDEK